MARNVVDELVVRLTADATKLQAELAKAEKDAGASGKRIGGSFATAFATASKLGLGAATAIGGVTAALTLAADKAADYADRIDKASQSTGFARGAFQELTFALDQNGIGFDQARQGLQDFNARLGQAASGNVAVAETYDRLGVAIRDANGNVRDSEAVFNDVLAALSELPSASQQAAEGGLLLGEEFSRRVIPALNAGAEGIEELRKKARELGIVLDDESVGALVRYKDEMAAFREAFGAASREITLEFLPLLTDGLLPALQNALRVFQNLPEPLQRSVSALIGVGSAAGAAAAGLRLLGLSAATLFGPAGLIGFAVVGGVAAIAAALAGREKDSLLRASEELTEQLAGGGDGTLTGALQDVADQAEGDTVDSLDVLIAKLRETGRVGVEEARRIQAALELGDLQTQLAALRAADQAGSNAGGDAPAFVGARQQLLDQALLSEGYQPGDLVFFVDESGKLKVRPVLPALRRPDTPAGFLAPGATANVIADAFGASPPTVGGAVTRIETRIAELEAIINAPFGGVVSPPGGGPPPPAGTDNDPVVVTFSRTATPVLFNEQRLRAQQGAAGFDPLVGFGAISDRGARRGDGGLAGLIAALDEVGPLDRTVFNTRTYRETLAAEIEAATAEAAAQAFDENPFLDASIFGTRAFRQGQAAAQDRAGLLENIGAGAVSNRGRTRGDGGVAEAAALLAAQTLERAIQAFDENPGLDRSATLFLATQAEQRRAALLASIGAGAVSDRGVTRGAPGLGNTAGGVFVPPTVPPEIQGLIDVGANVRLELERGAQATELAAQETKRAIITAGIQFGSDLASAIKSGSPSGIFGALTGGIGGLVGIANPFAGGLINLLGGLFGGFLPDGRDESEAARAAGARPNGAPAVELNLQVFQNLAVQSLTGGDRAAVDGLLDRTVERIESVLVSFGQRLTAVEARTA